jgi:hypothetical protein
MPTEDLITPETVTKEDLHALFEQAFFTTRFDSDGDLVVKDRYNTFVMPAEDGRHIRLMSLFGAKEGVALDAKLRLANRVNEKLLLVRSYVDEGGRFVFEHYIWLEGGVTKRNVVLATRSFQHVLSRLGELDEEGCLS